MEAFIYDFVRTPIGRGHPEKGALKDLRPLDLVLQLIKSLEQRNDLDKACINEMILGNVGQVGDQGGNLAKICLSYYGWDNVPGFTINSYCSSGMVAVELATAKTRAGLNEMSLAGGVEMLSRVPMFADQSPLYTQKDYQEATRFTQMGVAADLIATIEGISREELDHYAVLSHKRAAHAREKGYFDSSLIPIVKSDGNSALAIDENIKPQSTTEILANFEPLFASAVTPFVRERVGKQYLGKQPLKHFHHVGNSPNMADGASILLVGNSEKGKNLGLKPRAKIHHVTSKAVEPLIMLTGGQQSVTAVLDKSKFSIKDIDVHYYAEAFSSSCVKYLRDLNIDIDRFNPNGGTMSMGHAQGASGATLTGMLLEELERTDQEIGIASISGLAQGTAIIIQRV